MRAAIDAALREGETIPDVALQFEASPSAIFRHSHAHLSGVISKPTRAENEIATQPLGPPSSWRQVRRDVLAALKDATPIAMQKLVVLMSDKDSRVAMVAVKEMLDRSLGKPGDIAQIKADDVAQMDLTHLTPPELGELQLALATVRRLTDRSMRSVVIEG
jgi:hypothetical protein